MGPLTDILLEGVSLFESASAISGGAHLSVEEFVQLIPTEKNCRMRGSPMQHILSESNVREFLSGFQSNPLGS